MAGLRETKKARTRQRISDVATALFVARGFDAVTVAEVAEAAEVSKMTVFNHFPRKEDLLLDRGPEAAALMRDALADRADTMPPLAALRALAVDLARRRHPLSGVRDGTAPFQRVVLGSPALLGRLRELGGELEGLLATLLAQNGVARPELVAAMGVAAYRTVVGASAQRILDGETADAVVDDHVAALHAAFDALDPLAG